MVGNAGGVQLAHLSPISCRPNLELLASRQPLLQNRLGFALVLSQTGQEVGVSRATRTSRGIPASDDHLIPAALVPHLDHQAVSRGKAGWPNRGMADLLS